MKTLFVLAALAATPATAKPYCEAFAATGGQTDAQAYADLDKSISKCDTGDTARIAIIPGDQGDTGLDLTVVIPLYCDLRYQVIVSRGRIVNCILR